MIESSYGYGIRTNSDGNVVLNKGAINEEDVAIFIAGGSVTIDGVTINASIYTFMGTLNLESGTISSDLSGIDVDSAVTVNLNGKVEITSEIAHIKMNMVSFILIDAFIFHTFIAGLTQQMAASSMLSVRITSVKNVA